MKQFNKALLNFVLLISITMASSASFALSPKAVGLFIGTPDSLTFKAWESEIKAYDLGMSFSTSSKNYHIYGDFIHHFKNVLKENAQISKQIDFYVGGGAFVYNTKEEKNVFGNVTKESKTYLGVRAPFGIEWRPEFPIAVYLEFALGLAVVPETTSNTYSGIGVRYLF